ncbi:MAG TPA: hypothetical protein VKA94_10930 [Hyphomicrobiales bacterium]|nr:hypothetical protein [Hyphomicrobiales bacterium]
MRKSSKVGFAASLGLAILSASLVSDFSSDAHWQGFLSFANASIAGVTTSLPQSIQFSQSSILPAEVRRRALMNRVQQRLLRKSSAVDPILL